MTVHEASEEPPHVAVAFDDEQWQAQDGPGRTTAPALIYVRSRGKASHVFIDSSARPAPVDTDQGTLRETRELAPLDHDNKEVTVMTSTHLADRV